MRDFATEFARLNPEQQEAVSRDANTVVLAGPGSGKTATLVVKVAHLLRTIVQAPRGVACITFNNDAVDEFRRRLAEHGLHAGRRLYLGSVHSFCLNCIVRPYAPLVDASFAREVRVISERAAGALLERIASASIADVYMPSFKPTSTRIRRALACGESVAGFDDRDVAAVKRYEAKLVKQGAVDFEAMVLRSVDLVQRHSWIRQLLASRFPWIVVDEYQDLGGPLHKIVTSLADLAGVKVFAVGDPDQTVYDFTGAHPKYLDELAKRADFRGIRLRFNYRSGGDLIVASQAALAPDDGPRPYLPDPKRVDRGKVVFKKAKDHLEGHAQTALEAVRAAIAASVPP
ncbi:MAG: ATP-dependent helicase, partial [Deltaproteobacteria bacterium]|nr:ATP-dependent helicase [Deltaproteobacteria bacterium]